MIAPKNNAHIHIHVPHRCIQQPNEPTVGKAWDPEHDILSEMQGLHTHGFRRPEKSGPKGASSNSVTTIYSICTHEYNIGIIILIACKECIHYDILNSRSNHPLNSKTKMLCFKQHIYSINSHFRFLPCLPMYMYNTVKYRNGRRA